MSAHDSPYLYHYTDCAGFKGIVESNTLWATDIFFLNDSEEFRHGTHLLKEKLEERKNRSGQTTHPIYDSCLDVIRLVTGDCEGGSSLEEAMRVYVVSFSKEQKEQKEQKDLLSQWRAYCPKGGFALGFPSDALRDLAKNQGFALERCLYSEADKARRINCFLDTLRDEAQASDQLATSQPYEAQEDRAWDTADKFFWKKMLPILPIFKHTGFSEEREWRLISNLQESNHPGELRFRLGNGGLVPYKEITLIDDLWSDARIIIAPGPHKDRVKESVQQLLAWKRRAIPPSQIQHSEIPYRS